MNLLWLKASVVKSWRMRLVQKWSLLLEVFATLSMLLIFYLIDRFQTPLVGNNLQEALGNLKTSYFGYVALGLAMSELSNSSLGGVLGQFQEEKRYRCFEQYFASGISLQNWALVSGISNVFRCFFRFVLIYGVAILFLGLPLPSVRFDLAFLIFLCSLVPLWSLSLISMGSVLIFRRGNLIGVLLSFSFDFLGGVYVPLKVLPEPVAKLAEILPITPALRAMQKAFYGEATFAEILPDLVQLILLGGVFLPLGLLALKQADHFARKRGYYAFDT